jgi:hypothetical protein
MMSSVPNDLGDDDWRLVAVELSRLHQQLLAQARAMRAALAGPGFLWTVENSDVNGYLAPVRDTGLPESERAALVAHLDADITVLGHLTGRLEQLRSLVAQPLDGESLWQQ